jgi:hypothetical protein
MALNVDLGVSLCNVQDWKGIREKVEEVNSTKAGITNGETSLELSRYEMEVA